MDLDAMRNSFVLVALCLGLAACGPGVAEGPLPLAAATDSDDEDGRSTGDDDGPQETDDGETEGTDSETEDAGESLTRGETDTMEGWCEDSLVVEETVVSAEALVPGAEFVAMGNDCVLLRKPEENGLLATVVFLSSELPSPYEAKRVETVSDSEPLSITCYEDPLLDDRVAVVLMAGEDGEVTLMRASFDSGEITPMAGSESLAGVSLTRVVRLLRTAGNGINRLCAFGDGLFCLDLGDNDGEWVEEISPGEGGRFHDLGVLEQGEDWLLLVVGEEGRIEVGGPDGWRTLPAATDADLYTVTSWDRQWVAAGEGGVFVYGTLEEQTEAELLDGDVISINIWDDQPFTGITDAGGVFQGRISDQELLLCPQDDLSLPLLDSLPAGCGSYESFLILTPESLIGDYGCEIVVTI